MADWDTSNPTDNAVIAQYPANERAARSALVTNFGIDHHGTNDANVGKHTVVRLLEQSAQTATAGEGKLYAKDTSGRSELFWISDTGSPIQLTSGANGLLVNATNILSGTLPDARLSSNVPLLDSVSFSNPFTGDLAVNKGSASLYLIDPAGAANEDVWRLFNLAGTLSLATRTDANSAGAIAMTLTRNGTTVTLAQLAATEVDLTATTIDVNGFLDVDITTAGSIATFTTSGSGGSVRLQAADFARFTLEDTTAGTNLTNFAIMSTNGLFQVRAYDDAFSTNAIALQITKDNTQAITEVELNATTIDINGAADISGTLTVGGPTQITGGLTVTHTGPTVTLIESDAAADNRRWDIFASSEVLNMRLVNDANSATANWLRVQRTGITADEIELNATTLDFNGNVDISGTLVIGGESITVTPGSTAATSLLVPTGDTTVYSLLGRGGAGPGIQARWDSGTTNRYIDLGSYDNLGVFSSGLKVTNGNAVDIAGTLGVTGAATLSSTLGVTGATTLSSTLAVTGAVTAATIANSTSTTLVAGQLHFIDGDATLPNLTAGQWIQIINDGASARTISKNGSDTTYWSTTGASVSTSFTLEPRGVLTARCNPAGTAVYVSGSGISAAS